MLAMMGNALLLALRELRRNVMRSILTMLGIIIGVAAVIILVTLGERRHPEGYGADRQLGEQSADGQSGQAHGPRPEFGGGPVQAGGCRGHRAGCAVAGGGGAGIEPVHHGHLRQRELGHVGDRAPRSSDFALSNRRIHEGRRFHGERDAAGVGGVRHRRDGAE